MSSSTIFCASCGLPGDARSTNRSCPNNTRRAEESAIVSSPISCVSCGLPGHAQSTSRNCPNNPRRTEQPNVATIQGLVEVRCSSCQQLGHQRSSHLACPLNPARLAMREANENDAGEHSRRLPAPVGNAESDESELPSRHTLGRMNVVCNFCQAHMWLKERMSGSISNPQFQFCCAQGSIVLPPLEPTPPTIARLLRSNTEEGRDFLITSHLARDILEVLQQLMHEINPFVHLFKTMAQCIQDNGGASNIRMIIRADDAPDPRRYNAPNASEIGVIIGENAESSGRDIVICTRSDQLTSISEMHRLYDPLHYVLMFPEGEPGWNIETRSTRNDRVTVMNYYSFRLMYRNDGHHLHLFGRLFQQYIVDMYAKMEQNRLNHLRLNQSRLRADVYSGVQDALQLDDNNMNMNSIGQPVILPSSFIGSPRNMQQLYQDAMSIVRCFGKPDLFITFTCNPKWPEIRNELLASQTVSDRPDLTARVFNLKLRALLKDLTKNHTLGKVIGYVYTVEFQKRGLPHAHILLILKEADKPVTPEHYDSIVSAKIPDPQQFK